MMAFSCGDSVHNHAAHSIDSWLVVSPDRDRLSSGIEPLLSGERGQAQSGSAVGCPQFLLGGEDVQEGRGGEGQRADRPRENERVLLFREGPRVRLTSKGHSRDVSSGECAGSPAESGLTSAASGFSRLLHSAPKACVTSSGEGGSGRSHRWAKASARSGQISR